MSWNNKLSRLTLITFLLILMTGCSCGSDTYNNCKKDKIYTSKNVEDTQKAQNTLDDSTLRYNDKEFSEFIFGAVRNNDSLSIVREMQGGHWPGVIIYTAVFNGGENLRFVNNAIANYASNTWAKEVSTDVERMGSTYYVTYTMYVNRGSVFFNDFARQMDAYLIDHGVDIIIKNKNTSNSDHALEQEK